MISVCLLNWLPSWLIGLINWVDNVNWPLLRVSKLTFRALVLRLSLWRRANVPNVSFETLNGGQLTLSTQLIIPNYPVILSHRRNTTVSLETYPLHSFTKLVDCTFVVTLLSKRPQHFDHPFESYFRLSDDLSTHLVEWSMRANCQILIWILGWV